MQKGRGVCDIFNNPIIGCDSCAAELHFYHKQTVEADV
jgi:hypothetical protein